MNRLGSVAAMVLLLFSSPAHAQVAGSRLTKYAEPADAAKSFKIWVECVAGLDAKWARGVLETLPSTDAERALLVKRNGEDDRCLVDSRLMMDNRELRMSNDSVRGELARYYVRITLATRGPTQGAATAWLREGLAALPAGQAYDRARLVGHQFAACLADDHFAEARALVASVSGSTEQKATLSGLSPHFGSCLAVGAKLDLTVPILRLYLAEAVYHALTHTPKTVASGVAR